MHVTFTTDFARMSPQVEDVSFEPEFARSVPATDFGVTGIVFSCQSSYVEQQCLNENKKGLWSQLGNSDNRTSSLFLVDPLDPIDGH